MKNNSGNTIRPESRIFEKTSISENSNPNFDARIKVLNYALDQANADVEIHRVLVLVDLQGMYLALHDWLTSKKFPINDGFVLSRFAYFQIKKTFDQIARRVAIKREGSHQYLNDLFDSIKLDEHEGAYYIAEEINIFKGTKYLNVIPKFEIFYAPAPLRDIEWNLRKFANQGDSESKKQLNKILSGVVERKGIFERNYSVYDNFVKDLQDAIENPFIPLTHVEHNAISRAWKRKAPLHRLNFRSANFSPASRPMVPVSIISWPFALAERVLPARHAARKAATIN